MMSMGSFPKHLKLSVWLRKELQERDIHLWWVRVEDMPSFWDLQPHALVVGQYPSSYRTPPHSLPPASTWLLGGYRKESSPGVMRAPRRESGFWEDPSFLGMGSQKTCLNHSSRNVPPALQSMGENLDPENAGDSKPMEQLTCLQDPEEVTAHRGRRSTPALHTRSSEKTQQRNKNMTVLDEGVSLEERDDSRTERGT